MTNTVTAGPLTLPYLKPKNRRKVTSKVEVWGMFFILIIALCWGASIAIGFIGSVTALTLIGFFAVIFGLRNPGVGMIGVGMLCTLDALSRNYLLDTGGLLPWNTFNYWLLIVIATNLVKLLFLNLLPLRVLWIFSFVLVLQVFYSSNVVEGIQHWLGIFSLLGLSVYFLRAAKDSNNWIWFGLVNGSLAAIGGLMFNLFKENLPPINPNAYAYFPLTGVFCVCLGFRFAGGRSRVQLAMQLLAVLNLVWVFLTGSRGGMIMAAACLIYLLASIRRFSHYAALAILAFVIGAGVLSRFQENQAYSLHKIDKLLDPDSSMAGRTSGRSDLAMAGWKMFQQHPFFGVGTGGFADEYSSMSFKSNLQFRVGVPMEAHSGWIKTLAESGALGTSLFAAFVCSFGYVGWRRRQFGVLSIGLLATSALSIALLSTEFQTKGLWVLAAGSLVILYRGFTDLGTSSIGVPVRIGSSLPRKNVGMA